MNSLIVLRDLIYFASSIESMSKVFILSEVVYKLGKGYYGKVMCVL